MRNFIYCFCLILLGFPLFSQETTVKQIDLLDVRRELFQTRHRLDTALVNDSNLLISVINHPVLKRDSIKMIPYKLYPSLAPVPGYNIQNGLLFIVATNFSFLTGKQSTTNVSAISFNPDYSISYHQVMLPLVFNIWSKDNKINLQGDWRYYYYPTNTYGLGNNSSLSNWDLINYSYIRFYQFGLKQLDKSDFYAGVGYNYDYHFDISKIATGGSGTDFGLYNGNTTHTASSGPTLNLLYDSRKNPNNPIETAFYSNLVYRSNFTFLGSDQNWQSVYNDNRAYIKLSKNSDRMLTFWNLNWFTWGGKVPYFDLPSTGWDSYSNTGRGYIQGRLRGPAMIYLESEYRFPITKNGLFGGVLFVNGESVSELARYNFDGFLPGCGFGVRIKVNKFSGVNFAIDYGFGTQGSNGPAFNVSEVF